MFQNYLDVNLSILALIKEVNKDGVMLFIVSAFLYVGLESTFKLVSDKLL